MFEQLNSVDASHKKIKSLPRAEQPRLMSESRVRSAKFFSPRVAREIRFEGVSETPAATGTTPAKSESHRFNVMTPVFYAWRNFVLPPLSIAVTGIIVTGAIGAGLVELGGRFVVRTFMNVTAAFLPTLAISVVAGSAALIAWNTALIAIPLTTALVYAGLATVALGALYHLGNHVDWEHLRHDWKKKKEIAIHVMRTAPRRIAYVYHRTRSVLDNEYSSEKLTEEIDRRAAKKDYIRELRKKGFSKQQIESLARKFDLATIRKVIPMQQTVEEAH